MQTEASNREIFRATPTTDGSCERALPREFGAAFDWIDPHICMDCPILCHRISRRWEKASRLKFECWGSGL
jgi:hypothetical protein